HGRADPLAWSSSCTIRRPGSCTVACPRRPSSASNVDLPPPEHPEITMKRSISLAVDCADESKDTASTNQLMFAESREVAQQSHSVNVAQDFLCDVGLAIALSPPSWWPAKPTAQFRAYCPQSHR